MQEQHRRGRGRACWGGRTNQKRVSVCFVVRHAVFASCACGVCVCMPVSVCVCCACFMFGPTATAKNNLPNENASQIFGAFCARFVRVYLQR